MTVSDARRAMLTDLFAAIDARDTDRFLKHLTDDAVFRFASAPPVCGRDAVRAAVDGFFASIAGLSHELRNVVERDATLVCEGEVSYTRQDGSTIAMPFANVFDLVGDRIAGYRVYTDIGALYAP